MPAITIRNVPAATRDELAARAARSGRSLQEYLLRQLIEWADRPDNASLIRQARERAIAAGSSFSADDILAWRDMDRR